MTRIVFWRGGSRMPVSTGIGSARMARSVVMLTGAEQMNSVSRGRHFWATAAGAHDAATGGAWNMFMMVRMVPAMLTSTMMAHDDRRRIFWAFWASRR